MEPKNQMQVVIETPLAERLRQYAGPGQKYKMKEFVAHLLRDALNRYEDAAKIEGAKSDY